jgi:hypothetical protein
LTGKVCVGVIIILLLPTFIEVFAQVEEQEGNNTEGTTTRMTKQYWFEYFIIN